jgi:2-methylcitrate dehydratase PrpD
VIANTWAEEFTHIDAARPLLHRDVDLHVADTGIAFFAGCRSREAKALARFYEEREPAAAVCAMVRRTECDDIHVASCITPGSVVIPVALATTIGTGAPIERFDRAVAVGYAVGLRLGRALGGAAALGSGIWPTCLAAPVMAAAATAVCLGLDPDRMASALGLAAAGTSGRVGRPTGAPSGRWLSLGEAVAKGCRSAFAAADGFQGDVRLISPDWLAAIADPRFIQPEALLGGRAEDSLAQVGFKPFVSARQTTNAIVAFQKILQRGIAPEAMAQIEIGVPSINAAMVARPASSDDRLSIIADVRLQIAAAALRPRLLYSTERDGEPAPDLVAFAERVRTVGDTRLDSYLPDLWAGRATVTVDGQTVEEICTTIAGDPGERDSVARLLQRKLELMVPEPDRSLCAELIGGLQETNRKTRLAALWRAMLAAAEPSGR